MVEAGNRDTLLLEVQGVTFGYDRFPLLYNVNLKVNSGEMVGLLGPNGSGKTTLLRLLSGILHPRQGEVLLGGLDLGQWGRRQIARQIAVVPQELQVPFAFTVEQMVGLGRTPFTNLLGTIGKQDKAIVKNAMRAADILPLAERVFNELSGGERQRVVIAMALAQEPTLLLLDEPTSHLDIKYQLDTLELVQRLNCELGVTVIAAMHDLNLAARYFSRLILFQRGVVADGSPAEVLEPGLLRRVYGVNVQVGILRGAEHLSVLPPGNTEAKADLAEQIERSVLVLAGGGSGELLMRALADAHIPFIAGILNIGDSDYALALRLASSVISEQPYAPISVTTVAQLRETLLHAALLILCPMPVGPGNLVLLEETLLSIKRELPVLVLTSSQVDEGSGIDAQTAGEENLLQRTGIASRDYTGGEAIKLMQELLQAGAKVVASVGEVLEATKKLTFIKNSSI